MKGMDVIYLMDRAINEWNGMSDEPLFDKLYKLQIRAFIIGKGEGCTIDEIHAFITQDLQD